MSGVRDGSASRTVCCAVATVSYLPRARVAAESWRRHHPDSPFVLLLIDGQDWPHESEPFQIVLPEELGLAPEELETQKAIYNAFELSCALKPHLFRLLLDQGASAIVFTDTDTFFYAPVTDLADTAASAGLALIPHAARPPAAVRGYLPLAHIEYRRFVGGLFNLGFIAVGQGGEAFLEWWGERLARDCLTEPAAGIYVDERWVDWAPVYFDHAVVRDSSLNVAFWNLDERELSELDGRPMVDGAPLRHFHFAGFDPSHPDRLSKYLDDAWPPPPANPVLTQLMQEYAERLLECGSDGAPQASVQVRHERRWAIARSPRASGLPGGGARRGGARRRASSESVRPVPRRRLRADGRRPVESRPALDAGPGAARTVATVRRVAFLLRTPEQATRTGRSLRTRRTPSTRSRRLASGERSRPARVLTRTRRFVGSDRPFVRRAARKAAG